MGSGAVAYTALVVDADPHTLSATNRLFAGAGFVVAPALTFAEARLLLATARPDALVTTVRLAGLNGLHLIAIGRAILPDLVAVVTHTGPDLALQADASSQGALYFAAPDPKFLVDIVGRLLEARGPRAGRPARRWRRKRVRARVDATLGTASGLVVDISYGGAQLQLRQPVNESTLESDPIVFAPDLRLRARRVWARAAGTDGPWWYGLELDPPGQAAQEEWQTFVDAIT